MLNLIIFGSPGAGKGTQAQLLARDYNLSHISSGQLLREAALSEDQGGEISSYLDKGHLVPDDIIMKLMSPEIRKHLATDGLILDGYPRTIAQAKSLDKLFLDNNLKPAKVINLDLEESIAIDRIMSRAKYSNRSDDQLRVVSARLSIYQEQTKPLISYYQDLGRLISIDGRPDPETVNRNIQAAIRQ